MEYKVTYQHYQEALGQDKFIGLKCNGCDTVTFPPLGVCRKCSGTDLLETEMSGQGAIRTFTVIRVAPQGMKPPYVVAMVELDEGAYVTGNLVGINPDEADMALMGKKVKLGSQPVKDDTNPEEDRRVLTFELV